MRRHRAVHCRDEGPVKDKLKRFGLFARLAKRRSSDTGARQQLSRDSSGGLGGLEDGVDVQTERSRSAGNRG